MIETTMTSVARHARHYRDGRNVIPGGAAWRPRVVGESRPQSAYVALARCREALEAMRAEWEDLAANAVEPNVFYEPWMLLPALTEYGADRNLLFALVYQRPSRGAPVLCGLFPLELRDRYRGVPVPTIGLWKYVHCYLSTPLVRAGFLENCLEAFFEWLELAGDGRLLSMPQISGEGPLHETLLRCLERRSLRFATRGFERALFRPRASSDAYLSEAVSGKSRKEHRRQGRRLSEKGRLETDVLSPDGEVREWVDEFLGLEASGWKGTVGTALGSSESDRRFFRAVAGEAHHLRRLMMLGLRLDGRAIAHKCNFLAGEGSFAFKIAFDESYRRFSPGVLLELENVRLLHERGVRWMDSCAEPGHFMAERLWIDRRRLETILAATRRSMSELLVLALPALGWLSHRVSGRSASETGASGWRLVA